MQKISLCLFILLLSACSSAQISPVRETLHSAVKQTYRIAAAQFRIEANQTPEGFFRKVESLVQEAANQKADLVVFPELLVMDLWALNSKSSERELAQKLAVELTPLYFEKVREWSARHHIAILAGTSPRLEGKEIFNTALLAFPDGRTVFQDKVFLTHWEKEQGWSAGKKLRVFDAPWGRSVILVCFDSEFPLLSQMLTEEKPEWLFIPSMTESAAGLNRVRWSAQARAVEHFAFVVVAGTVGRPAKDWEHHGQGLLLEPWDGPFKGIVSEGGKNQAGLVLGQFDLKALRAGRESSRFYPVKEQLNRKREDSFSVEVFR